MAALMTAIINIEDKRAREREKKNKHAFTPARLVEGQRAAGWREALNELSLAYQDESGKSELGATPKDLSTSEVTSSLLALGAQRRRGQRGKRGSA